MNALNTFRDTLKTEHCVLTAQTTYSCMGLGINYWFLWKKYPEVKLELTSDMKFTNIIVGRFDVVTRYCLKRWWKY